MPDLLAHTDTGDGPPIVFLHGITADRTHWAPVVEHLVDRFRCVNVDLLGHGESHDADDVGLFAQVPAVGELIAGLDLDRPVLVGHSYGGFVATFAGTMLPVAGVVSVDQPFDTSDFGATIGPHEDTIRHGDLDAFMATFLDDLGVAHVPDERRSIVTDHMTARREVLLSVWSMVLETPPEDLTPVVEEGLRGVAVPHLSIFGRPITDEERRLHDLIPDGRLEHWGDLGHFVQLVDPERTAARVASFAADARGEN